MNARALMPLAFIAATLLGAGAAHAEDAGKAAASLRSAAFASSNGAITLDNPDAGAFPKPTIVMPYGGDGSAPRMDGIATTSVSRQVATNATGFAGFICGLQPAVGHSGASAAYGDDPHGRFVGAKLSVSFN
jgi:hypothetical protein